MIAAAVLALSLSPGSQVQSAKLDQLAQPPAAATRQVVSVILDCQIASKSLTDCKAVNDVADASVVAEAIRMAGGVSVPDRLADSGARIRVKMNVAP
jgi:hypothetical protein